MLNKLKHLIIGSPLPTYQLAEKRLNKIRALAAFSPDALSSIAYANQEIYLGLVVAGSAGLALAWPIGLAITALLVIAATATMLILAVAANTSFAGFPRLAAILARDGYLPRQLTSLGDRLVFANGIVALSLATGLLIIVFEGASHALVPLFAVGVFLAYTLSQVGMVIHWKRDHQSHWQLKALINGVGGLTTAVTLVVVGYSKFLEGAWITIVLIPLIVHIFRSINNHYRNVSKQLSLHGLPPSLRPYPAPRVVIPISSVHRGVIDAVDFARGISKDVTAV
jgi:amino acid transporter